MQHHDPDDRQRTTHVTHSKRDSEVKEKQESSTLKLFSKDGAAWRMVPRS